jgi:hypothetical protein
MDQYFENMFESSDKLALNFYKYLKNNHFIDDIPDHMEAKVGQKVLL